MTRIPASGPPTHTPLAVRFALAVALIGGAACGDDPLPGQGDAGADMTGQDGAGGDGTGRDAGADGRDGADLPIDPACAALAKARCQRTDECTAGFGISRAYGDKVTCERVLGQTCTVGLRAPGTGTSPTSVEACAAAMMAQSCADLLRGVDLEACRTVPGMRPEASPCGTDGQCASAACRIEPGAACGKCVMQIPAGGACADARCQPGLSCAPPDSICTAPGPANADCDQGHPCEPGLDCVGADPMMGIVGKCAPFATMVGQACDPMRKTTASCDGRLGVYCHPTSKVCEMAGLADAGAPCGPVDGKFVACRAGATCYRPGMGPGTCIAPVGEGAPCNADTGPGCIPPAFCERPAGSPTGLCRLREPAMCGA